MNSEKVARIQSDLMDWGAENRRSFPWREDHATPYEVLLAEIFLKQTRAPTVERIYKEFLKEFPEPAGLLKADREDIIEVIRPLGLYNYRTDALLEIAAFLSEQPLPESEEELRQLPQVGPYVANATLCFAFGQDRPIVDTNVERIYSRIFMNQEVDVLGTTELWELAEELLPEGCVREFNLALLDFGAAVCTDSSPLCEECFASEYCDYYQEREVSEE